MQPCGQEYTGNSEEAGRAICLPSQVGSIITDDKGAADVSAKLFSHLEQEFQSDYKDVRPRKLPPL